MAVNLENNGASNRNARIWKMKNQKRFSNFIFQIQILKIIIEIYIDKI